MNVSMNIYADDCFIGSAILGCQDGLLSNVFGQRVTSELRPNGVLFCRCGLGRPGIDETMFLNVIFED